jgi:hypothetical protein
MDGINSQRQKEGGLKVKIRAYGVISKKKKELVKSLVNFSLETLVPNDNLNLNITLKFVPEDQEHRAWAVNEFSHHKKPKKFTVILPNDIEIMRLLFRTAHETTHIKQWYVGDLVETKDEVCYWKGRRYDPSKNSYWLHPWEIEAHGLELTLPYLWAKVKNLTNESWYNNYNHLM